MRDAEQFVALEGKLPKFLKDEAKPANAAEQLALAWLWRRFFQPPKPGAEKNATYECGVESIGDAQIQFRSQYYLYAIIFLIFDVEAIFLVPFAVAFTGLPVGAFIAILIFLLLLIEGLIWAWGKGCLNWAR